MQIINSKFYRTTQDDLNNILDFINAKVQIAVEKIEDVSKLNAKHELSVLEKMILRNGKDSTLPTITAIDLIAAGIDTTGNSLGFVLYHLGK